MGVFVALALGYVIGARAGSRDLDDVLEAARAIRDSQEMADLLSALRMHAGHTLRELADMLEREGPEADEVRARGGAHARRALVPRDIVGDDVVARVSRLFERD